MKNNNLISVNLISIINLLENEIFTIYLHKYIPPTQQIPYSIKKKDCLGEKRKLNKVFLQNVTDVSR